VSVGTRRQAGGPVLMVDWLGRGGIAHCTEAWARELRAAGEPVELVTRFGRELVTAVPGTHGAGRRGGALIEHLAVVASARRLVRELEPRAVVLHGTVLPQAELGLLRSAHRRGATVILIAHEPVAPHDLRESCSAYVRLIRSVDVVVAHTRFVADQVRMLTRRDDLTLLPLPLPVGLIAAGSGARPVVDSSPVPLALSFGNLHRAYKGSITVEQLATGGVEGWRFALVGKGAPTSLPGVATVPRFLEAGELVATVSSSAATLLPYRRASQSAAVVLAQALGSVVVATAVGGISEQVKDGVTGRLLPLGAEVDRWRELLIELSDPQVRALLASQARAAVEGAHAEFAAGVLELVGKVR
jgi:glycosyltransferase involved in cell wall biosynthesis